MEPTLTRSSCCSSATGRSSPPSCPPGICCSRWRRFPPSVSSCSTAPSARPPTCRLPPDYRREDTGPQVHSLKTQTQICELVLSFCYTWASHCLLLITFKGVIFFFTHYFRSDYKYQKNKIKSKTVRLRFALH